MEMRRFIWGIAYSLWARVLSIVAEKRAGTSSTLFPTPYPLILIPYFLLAALVLGLWLEGLPGPAYAFQSPPPLRVDFEQRVKCNRPFLMAWMGEPFTYTLVLTNRGRSLGLTTLSDSLPAGVVWADGLTASPGITPTYDTTARRVEWVGEVLTSPTVITLSWRVAAPTVPPVQPGSIPGCRVGLDPRRDYKNPVTFSHNSHRVGQPGGGCAGGDVHLYGFYHQCRWI